MATLVGEGLPNRRTASHLYRPERTVEFHVRSILAKPGLRTRTDRATRVVRQG